MTRPQMCLAVWIGLWVAQVDHSWVYGLGAAVYVAVIYRLCAAPMRSIVEKARYGWDDG